MNRCWMGILVFSLCIAPAKATDDSATSKVSPITVARAKKKGFATVTHRRQPADRIGYRFFEHSPLTWGTAPRTTDEKTTTSAEVQALIDDFSRRPGVLIMDQKIREKKRWIDQQWRFYLSPAEDGVDLLWVIETGDQGLPEYDGVQPDCLHAIVNLGGLPPRSKRAIRGKIYWYEGTKADLAKRWQLQFGKPREK
ncbi:MAG: hypothetical protein JW818_00450 [Pirellulales bacterium]|nr:hypothetical protein [Pirellulales bacterium]